MNKMTRKKLSEAEKFARGVARRCELLSPQFSDIDPHDLELLVAELLKTPEERMRVMFLQQHNESFVSFNKTLRAKLAEALAQAELEALMLNDADAFEAGVNAPKKKIDLLLHDHKGLQSKLRKFERAFGVARLRPYKSSPKLVRTVGRLVSVDFIFADPNRESFKSIKARAKRILFGKLVLPVVTRQDVVGKENATHHL